MVKDAYDIIIDFLSKPSFIKLGALSAAVLISCIYYKYKNKTPKDSDNKTIRSDVSGIGNIVGENTITNTTIVNVTGGAPIINITDKAKGEFWDDENDPLVKRLLKTLNEKDAAIEEREKLCNEMGEKILRLKEELSAGKKDPLEEEAQRCLLIGNLECAESKLLEYHKKCLANSGEDRGAAGKSALMLANLAAGRLEDDKALDYYEKAYRLDEENPEILSQYGCFLGTRGKYDSSIIFLEKALAKYRSLAPVVYLPNVAMTLNDVGVSYTHAECFDKAESAYEEALNIYRTLVEKNPDTYLDTLALTLNNLGTMYNGRRDFGKAETAYNESLKIHRMLNDKQPGAYLPGLAMTLYNLGNSYALPDNYNYEKAGGAYQEALKFRRTLAEKNSDAYLPGVAKTLHNLGSLCLKANRLEEAKNAFEETLDIYRKLAEKNAAYLPNIAFTLNHLGVLHGSTASPFDSITIGFVGIDTSFSTREFFNTSIKKAEGMFDEALAIFRKLDNQNPNQLELMAGILCNLGRVYSMTNRLKQAESAYEEGLEVYRKLADESPKVLLPMIIRILKTLAYIYKKNNRSIKAKAALAEADELQKTLDAK